MPLIPAEAGTQVFCSSAARIRQPISINNKNAWVPASAGMTGVRVRP